MGESGQVVLTPGIGRIEPLFTRRAHSFTKSDERSTPYVYEVVMQAASIEADQNLTESIYSPVPGGAQPVPDDVRDGANGRTKRAASLSMPTTMPLKRSSNLHSANGKIKVAMTASSHVGHLRFDFDGTGDNQGDPHV